MTANSFRRCSWVLAFAAAIAGSVEAQDVVVRGPYLQSGTQNTIVVRWRTSNAVDSQVSFGTAPGSLTNVVVDPAFTTEHEITLTGLVAGIRYFYAVGTTTDVLAGGDTDHSFVTAPAALPLDPLRLWVIGDSGTAHQRQLDPAQGEIRDAQGVRDAYLRYGGLGDTLVTAGAVWSFLDDGSDQGSAWRNPGFDDSAWSAGAGELGYGDNDEQTLVNCGPSAPVCNVGNFVTTYFRHRFAVLDASSYMSLTLSVLRDDGAIVYLNGTEVLRTNMPAGPVDASSRPSIAIGGAAEHLFHRGSVDPGLLTDGENVLAVEVHQISSTSSDISLNVELFAQTGAGVPTAQWLMLGDNAYNVGTDDEWQRAVFDPFATVLRSTTLWPVLGNHDVVTLNGAPYFDAMTLPTNAEAGGVPSGTEAYYSFDYSNIHFVALDSTHAASRQPGSAMLTWLGADLAATFQDWVIALWHHPPYTKGSHNSDDTVGDVPLVEMRENVLPILEAGGVDVVLSGHSHSYERSNLIDGFYTTPTLLGDGNVLDSGSGDPFTDDAYSKSLVGPLPNQGAVYSVVGSSGRNHPLRGNLDHPVMFYSVHDLGSLVVDVDDNRLDGTFINRSCSQMGDPSCELDSFTLVKGEPRAGYIRTSTQRASVARGESVPFRLELENITDTQQSYVFGMFLLLPNGDTPLLLAQPLMFPAQTQFDLAPSLPVSASAPRGSWALVAFLLTENGDLIDASVITFVVN